MMARPKQTKPGALSNNRADDESDSDDELATEQEQEPLKKTTVKAKKPTTAESSSRPTVSRVPSGSAKTAKPKTKARNEAEMDVDSEDPSSKRGAVDVQVLKEENERLSQSLRKLTARYDELQKACDELAAMKRPERNEMKLQEAVDSMRNVVEKNNKLLDLRRSDYTKSRLINSDPSSAVEFVTREWAERLRDEHMDGAAKELAELRAQLEESEAALGALQKELDMEVANSKKLQAEASRRPHATSAQTTTTAPASSASRAVVHELEKKIELYENMTEMVIVNYTENIRQPGNVKAVTFTCLLTMNERELPFKLSIWDQAQSDESDEREHVVYYPSEPVDPSIDLQYLASSFTFPRSQLSVFYQNIINVVSPPEADEDE
ncbi:hypothetical protein PIIN_07053 [Serendipita indica DSM 11827]|uniref:Monopolin complex subunit Csm1/Pcs1 C-terminal domain-containing protein n=1 Tax=Serendipita indica (strain DSM 11827) TaxID=1109443 RepID=G4TP56_SERID|nr:hypothetical protein PIIN_07053 [Serendipita indica DSM 11827]